MERFCPRPLRDGASAPRCGGSGKSIGEPREPLSRIAIVLAIETAPRPRPAARDVVQRCTRCNTRGRASVAPRAKQSESLCVAPGIVQRCTPCKHSTSLLPESTKVEERHTHAPPSPPSGAPSPKAPRGAGESAITREQTSAEDYAAAAAQCFTRDEADAERVEYGKRPHKMLLEEYGIATGAWARPATP